MKSLSDTMHYLGVVCLAITLTLPFSTVYAHTDFASLTDLDRTFFTIDTVIVNEQICAGEVLTVEGVTYTESGNYAELFTHIPGYDTLLLLVDLQVLDPVETQIEVAACHGDTVQIDQSLFLRDTSFTRLFESAAGCDSLVHYDVQFETVAFEVFSGFTSPICAGDSLQLTYPIHYPEDDIPFANPDTVYLEDARRQAIPIEVAGFPEDATLGDIYQLEEICLTIEHSYMYDLDIVLVTPLGDSVLLQEQAFIPQAVFLGEPYLIDTDSTQLSIPGNGYKYCWTDDVTLPTWIEYVELTDSFNHVTIPAGSYRPFTDLSEMDGTPLNGLWQLVISDLWASDNGYLFGWSLHFSAPTDIPIQPNYTGSWETDSDVLFNEEGTLVALPEVGEHQYTFTLENNNSGCTRDTTFTVQVLAGMSTEVDTTFCGAGILDGTVISDSGTYTFTDNTGADCDQTMIYHVTVAELPDTTYHSISSCDPAEVGLSTEVFLTTAGCDSVVVTEVYLQAPIDTTYLQMETCLPAEVGLMMETFTGANGCDSVVVRNVVLQPNIDTTYVTAVSCNTADAGTVITDYTTAAGCDSTVVLTTTYQAAIDTTFITDASCNPQDIGTFTDQYTTAAGCDSIVVTTILLTPPTDTTFLQAFSCIQATAGISYEQYTTTQGCDSIVAVTTTYQPDTTFQTRYTCDLDMVGTAQDLQHLPDGCDTLVVTDWQYLPLEYNLVVTSDTCGQNLGSAQLILFSGDLAYTIDWSAEGAAGGIVQGLGAGAYAVTVTATDVDIEYACTEVIPFTIADYDVGPASALFTYTSADATVSFAPDELDVSYTYTWDFGDGSTSASLQPTHTFNSPGTYEVCLQVDNGCEVSTFCTNVQIDALINQISGTITSHPDHMTPFTGINYVTVHLTGNTTMQTDVAGQYTFPQLTPGADYVITPSKSGDDANGISMLDFLMVSLHVNTQMPLTSPYQLLAADADCSGNVTTGDALQILGVVRNVLPGFDQCPSWHFIPQSHNLTNPFAFPDSIVVNDLAGDYQGADFYGVKVGDVGGQADLTSRLVPEDTVIFRMNNLQAAAGDTLVFEVKGEHFSDLLSFQLEMGFDTSAMAYLDLQTGALSSFTEESLGLTEIEQGHMRWTWYQPEFVGETMDSISSLYQLRFLAKSAIFDVSDHLALRPEALAPEAYDIALNIYPVRLEIDELVTNTTQVTARRNILLQNRPNPFSSGTTIAFSLPEGAFTQLVVTNLLGQPVYRYQAALPSGAHEVLVPAKYFQQSGVYFYTLKMGTQELTKRMIYQAR